MYRLNSIFIFLVPLLFIAPAINAEEGGSGHYMPGSMASFADGPIELTLPYKDIQKFLSGNIKT